MSEESDLNYSRFRISFEQAPYSIQILRPDGTTIMVNNAFKKLHGVDDDFVNNFILKQYNMLQDPQLKARGVMPLIERAFKGEVIEMPEIFYDPAEMGFAGHPSWTIGTFYPLKDEKGVLQEIVLTHEDVTKEHYAREETERVLGIESFLSKVTSLLHNTLDYNLIIEQVATAAIPFLADGSIIDLLEGDKIRRILTRHFDPVVESYMLEMRDTFPPAVNSPAPTPRVIRSGEPELLENVDLSVILSHTTSQKHAELIQKIGVHSHIAVPLEIRGKVIGALNFHITTDRKKFDQRDLATAVELGRRAAIAIENARLYQEAVNAIKEREDFISIASHELKTPITSLKLQWEVATRSIGDADKTIDPIYVKKLSAVSNRQLDRMTRLVEDMLDISRIATGRLAMDKKPVDVADILAGVHFRFLDQLNDLKIEMIVGKIDSCPVVADAFRVEQIITNLLTNAIRYGQKKPIEISLHNLGDKALLKVTDHGRGIPKPDQERIFERFVRAINVNDTSGLGLGLYISRQIVVEHQGRLWVESQSDGSTFLMELPLKK